MTESEKDIGKCLAAARAGSTEALGKAFQACRNYLLLVAGQQLDPGLQAKGGESDLVQETFLRAQRDFARFQGTSEGELLAWLRQILVNNVANFSRRYRSEKRAVHREVGLVPEDSRQVPGPALFDPLLTPSSEAVEREQAEVLRRALQRLPDEYRQVIVLRYLEGCSFEQIGSLMDRSADAARKLWSRAMGRLREEWEGSS
jgi:RNA polymerase sigma-70 factor (ECF subfamily)